MTQAATVTAPDIGRHKRDLEARLAELAGAFPERDELQIEHLADPIDQITSNAGGEMVIQRIDRQASLIQDLRSALAKLHDGEYGVCEQCERPMPRKRLDAVPWARLCVSCQSAEEAARQIEHAA